MTVAFVFEAGSSLAAVQVGMLRALVEAGIRPDIVVGSSLAGSSVLGLLPPVMWRGKSLIDGGISADVPILQAEALGATTSYVLPSLIEGPADAPVMGALPLMMRSVGMLLGRTSGHDLAAARGAVHVLPVPPLGGLNPLDFRHGAEYVRVGYDSAQGWLARHASLVAAG